MFYPHAYETDPRVRKYIVPTRVVRTTGCVNHPDALLQERPGQISLERPDFWPACELKNEKGERASVLVDFGREIHGSARIYSWYVYPKAGNRVNLKVRFGESVSEAMTPWPEKGSTNDHANRDTVMNVGFLSANETNETGFRFLNVELLDDDASIVLYMIEGVWTYRDIPQTGTFRCSDERINDIYDTAVYTAHMNMQEYLWDGIKRDRLVWCGDIYPSELTILSAFGPHEILRRSLDIHKTITPPTGWMNGMPTYSLWWLISHEAFYQSSGDLEYLKAQHDYMKDLIHHVAGFIGPDNHETLPHPFLDWPNSENPVGIHAGQQALLARAFEKTAFMMREMGDAETAAFCEECRGRVASVTPDHGGSKQGAALMALWGLADPKDMNDKVIEPGQAHGYSTFLGWATLAAKAEAGDLQGALRDMKQYWGAMLDLGATTFWEDFNLDWTENAAPIDQVVPEGKKDIHGDFGAYCYVKLRHSLCHAWASGPAPFLTRYVLGIRVEKPGCRAISIQPNLCGLEWAEGSYPTPYGPVHVRADKHGVTVDAPKEVQIIR